MYLPKKNKLTFSDLSKIIIESNDLNLGTFCIYTTNSDVIISERTDVYIDDYPTGDEEGEDLFSDFVIEHNLELLYYGDQFVDVINNLRAQNVPLTIENIIIAANFWLENDNFFTFSG
ncbi:Conserved hypothetical protein [Vibrio nigripulchritudo SFn27]|uniref:Uncharacterized protein n=1 Tax=Vibrio nigripulchritudo TaxID=28173 RepID=U4KI54_9VIBR|nr:hypothetical protein [Vibrio nigripulchritudo]CCN84311.1 Conserved hypothetical protein [Vibrio nigripulchritudo BLFn1]CCN91169.1 Conserved hypothetical protein [Vibrio nigripulchritudo SFn27]CCN94925.1 Conserved hypothetical protein [Vibrio nigripulchritudo ENn2]CCO40003.1 Conserved hypothetical protein [Vibrio nigripulchritudo SFn135]CCO55492.1 Conserved hypothetical protein [Vibrio nigripulchritudo Wn13]